MKVLMVILLVLVAALGISQVVKVYQRSEAASSGRDKPVAAPQSIAEMYPLPPALEASLQAARAGGAQGMREWIGAHGGAVQDPRRADVELDFARLLVPGDPAGARRLYQSVKARTPPDSPVAPKVKELSRLFE